VKVSHGVTLYFPSVSPSSTAKSTHHGQPNSNAPASTTTSAGATSVIGSTPTSNQKDSEGDDDTLANYRASTAYQEVDILLRVTAMQDILADLGKPSRVFYKEQDKMKIHSVADDGAIASKTGKGDAPLGLAKGGGDDERGKHEKTNCTLQKY
jgi:hypothetical protein